MKRKLSILVVLLAIAGLVSLAVSAQTKKAPAKKAPAGKAAGKSVDVAAIWKQHCQKCHAADGKGIESLEPPDMTKEAWQAKATDKEITDAINDGKNIMPGFKDTLKPAEVAALVKHIRTLGSAKAAGEKQ